MENLWTRTFSIDNLKLLKAFLMQLLCFFEWFVA